MPYASEVMRSKRQELGVKLAAFAERIPISYGHYRNVEAGSKPCAIEIFHVIARELGVSVGDLIADPPDRPRVNAEDAASAVAAESETDSAGPATDASTETPARAEAGRGAA